MLRRAAGPSALQSRSSERLFYARVPCDFAGDFLREAHEPALKQIHAHCARVIFQRTHQFLRGVYERKSNLQLS
jgi:hypothetical protein